MCVCVGMKQWMWVSALATVGVLGAQAGCKKELSLEDGLKAQAPKVDAKLAVVDKIANSYRTADASAAFQGGLKVVEQKHGEPMVGNTLITYAADLDALAAGTAPPTNSNRHTLSIAVVECWWMMRKRELGGFRLSSSSSYFEFETSPGKGFQPAIVCDRLVQATHLAVVLSSEASGGAVAAPGDTDKTPETFERAQASGKLAVFDLATGAYLGQRAFSATGSGSIAYKTDNTGYGAQGDASEAVGKDLQGRTWRAIEDAISGR